MIWKLREGSFEALVDLVCMRCEDDICVVQDLDGDHKGVYYPLTGMSKEVQQQLIDDHFLFKVNDESF